MGAEGVVNQTRPVYYSPPPGQGNGKKIAIVIVILLLLCLGVCCIISLLLLLLGGGVLNDVGQQFDAAGFSDKIKQYEQNMNNLNGGNGFSLFGSNKEWPSDMPPDVPQFKYGEINSAVSAKSKNNDLTWTVDYQNVQAGALTNYQKDLQTESAKWTVNTLSNTLTAEYSERGLSIIVTLSGTTAELSVTRSSN